MSFSLCHFAEQMAGGRIDALKPTKHITKWLKYDKDVKFIF
jgi:hypothetical protein